MSVNWQNDSAPAISAENLGQAGGSDGLKLVEVTGGTDYLEQGGEDVTDKVAAVLDSYVESRADSLIENVLNMSF